MLAITSSDEKGKLLVIGYMMKFYITKNILPSVTEKEDPEK